MWMEVVVAYSDSVPDCDSEQWKILNYLSQGIRSANPELNHDLLKKNDLTPVVMI
jgi:hypothetical protein